MSLRGPNSPSLAPAVAPPVREDDIALLHGELDAERLAAAPARDMLGWQPPYGALAALEGRELVRGLQRPLAQDAIDTSHLNEICVCCQGSALDLDELVGLVIPQAGGDLTFGLELTMRGVPAAAGAMYGYQNYRGSIVNRDKLVKLQDAVASDLTRTHRLLHQVPSRVPLSPAAPDIGPVLGAQRSLPGASHPQRYGIAHLGGILAARVDNLAAQQRTIALSLSLQRFVCLFDGMVPMLSAALTVGGAFWAPLGALAGAALVVYCFAHAIRYAVWDLAEIRGHSMRRLPANQDSGVWEAQGEQAFSAYKRYRARILVATTVAFCGYGLAACGLLAVAMGALGATWEASALWTFGASMGAVLVLNNGPIKDIYGKNSKERLSRVDLGDEAQIISLLGRAACEERILGKLATSSTAPALRPLALAQALAQQIGITGLVTLRYLTATLGITGLFADDDDHHHHHHNDYEHEHDHAHAHGVDHAHSAHTAGAQAKPITLAAKLHAQLRHASVGLERSITRSLHHLRAAQISCSAGRAAALEAALDAYESLLTQPDGRLPYAVDASSGERGSARLSGLLRHLQLERRVDASAPATGSAQQAQARRQTAAIMALTGERRPELQFAASALCDHLHARRRINAGAATP